VWKGERRQKVWQGERREKDSARGGEGREKVWQEKRESVLYTVKRPILKMSKYMKKMSKYMLKNVQVYAKKCPSICCHVCINLYVSSIENQIKSLLN
jgi:hypothetical protein